MVALLLLLVIGGHRARKEGRDKWNMSGSRAHVLPASHTTQPLLWKEKPSSLFWYRDWYLSNFVPVYLINTTECVCITMIFIWLLLYSWGKIILVFNWKAINKTGLGCVQCISHFDFEIWHFACAHSKVKNLDLVKMLVNRKSSRTCDL